MTTRLGAPGSAAGGEPRPECPACAAREGGSRAAARGSPSGTRDRVHFALFAGMCAFGAFVFVDTGPFPLNIAFAAFAVSLPLALAAWRFRAGRRRPR